MLFLAVLVPIACTLTSVHSSSVWVPRRNRRQLDNSLGNVDTDNAVIEVFNDCKCVFEYQCDEDNNIITDGRNILNFRMEQQPKRIKCIGGKFEGEFVCCKINGTSSKVLNGPNMKSPDETEKETPPKLPKKMNCGIQRPILNVRLFAGEDELTPMAGEFPWIGAIFRKISPNDDGVYVHKFYCSGSLIHPKVILTANHYFHNKSPDEFTIILNGNIELPVVGQNTSHERKVIEIVHHPDYYGGALYNDVALLILDKPYPIERSNYLNKICLPPDNVNLENMKCLVAGWGKGSTTQGETIMKKVEMPFVNHAKCQNQLRKTRLGSGFDLHKTFVCAGGEEGKDACKGDGGSPLMCPYEGENKYFQLGIVSWGIGCGQKDVPGVYGNVMKFKKWIKRELDLRNLGD